MTKKCYRFFGGLLKTQEKWLNKMASQGYRLIRTEKVLYEFEKCQPNEFQYRIDFIAEKSKTHANEYRSLLEEMGYRVFFKNINLNYSIGKVRLRPWAEKGGRIATNANTFNRELLIVEKKNDSKSFELHTSYEDKINYYTHLRNPYLLMFLFFLILGIIKHLIALSIFSCFFLIPALIYQINIIQIKQKAKIQEW